MTETQPRHRQRRGSAQTKALAGLVAVMLAAAIVALVFVTSGGGSSNKQAGAAAPSDVGRTSSADTPSAPATTSAAAPTTKPAPTSSSASPTASPSSASTSSTGTSKATTSSHSAQTKVVYYTVRKGDTLYGIGQWFRDHGYLTLYQWNKSVIGRNPDLIFPGQRIVVVSGKVGVDRKVPTK